MKIWLSLLPVLLIIRNINVNCDMETAQADFALKLLRQSGPSNSFAILSPFSVSVALAMVYAGADGETKSQIGNAIASGASDEEIIHHFSSLMNELNEPTNGYKMLTANKIYIQEGFHVLQTFKNLLNEKFGGQFQEVNFAQSAATANLINKWVEEKTNSKIQRFISARMLSPSTLLTLVNAIYFKGDWVTKFDANRTTQKQFHIAENSITREVEMMRMTHPFAYTEDDSVQVLGLPYMGNEVFMYVFLPKQKFGLSEWEKSMNGEKMLRLVDLCEKNAKIIVELPKFKLESKFQLRRTLEKLGIHDAFSSNANFSGICDHALAISHVIHQANIETNEKGTEAAAATAILMMRSMRPAPLTPLIRFIADHPFMFAIVKHKNILFIGRFH